MRPYKLEGVNFPVHLDESIDIPILHPFRYHSEMVLIRRNTQERQHVWMAKSVPCYDLLTEPLQGSASSGQRTILAGLCKLTPATLPVSLFE